MDKVKIAKELLKIARHLLAANINMAPLEDQVRHVLFKLADAGKAGIPASGGYLPVKGMKQVQKEGFADVDDGVLYINRKGYRWIRKNP